MKKNLSIALLGCYFGWSGGADFLRHIANGLLAKQQAFDLKIHLLLPVDNQIDAAIDVLRVVKRSVERSIKFKRPWLARPTPCFHESILDFFSQTQAAGVEIVYYESSPSGLLRCLKKLAVDVALPVNGTLGRDYPVSWVGYAPDFQHKYLPENFSSQECFARDIHFAQIFRDATAAVVNSKSVADDIRTIFPYTTAKIYTLPFSPNPVAEWLDELAFDVREKYSLPDHYFLISNQFWIHKDHLTAFRALRTVEGDIVCTGTMADYRRPHYLAELEDFLADNELKERVTFLGHVPKRDQIEIMKKSLAVVQPTLFEGGPGGGCVCDAVSLGVPVIASAIPVNNEINAGDVRFFKAGDSEDLAERMREVINEDIIRPSKDQLLMMGKRNLERLGDCLLEAVKCVV